MAPTDKCLASMAKLSFSLTMRTGITPVPNFLMPSIVQQTRSASQALKRKEVKKKRVLPRDFSRHKIVARGFPRWSLSEAMRIIRASEVGQPPARVKYEVHIHLRAVRGGPVIRGSLRLPNPVQSDWRIAVICPEGSEIANAATTAGAVAVGEESLFEAIRAEKFDFDRLLCHESSEKALQKAGLGRILGPKGMMPSPKTKTIVKDVAKAIRDSSGSTEYRERDGCIRMAVAQLGHSGEQVKNNIQTVMEKVKRDCADISDTSPKDIHEVILSSTFGPALTLDGKMQNEGDRAPLSAYSSLM